MSDADCISDGDAAGMRRAAVASAAVCMGASFVVASSSSGWLLSLSDVPAGGSGLTATAAAGVAAASAAAAGVAAFAAAAVALLSRRVPRGGIGEGGGCRRTDREKSSETGSPRFILPRCCNAARRPPHSAQHSAPSLPRAAALFHPRTSERIGSAATPPPLRAVCCKRCWIETQRRVWAPSTMPRT